MIDGFLVLLAAAGAVAAGWRGGRALAGEAHPVDRLLVGVTLAVTVLLAAVHLPALAEILGGMARVRPSAMAMVSLALAGAIWVLLRPHPVSSSPASSPAGAAMVSIGGVPVSLRAAVGALLGLYALVLVEGLTSPPAGWDARVYHLPVALRWLHTGSLAIPGPDWRFALPGNGECLAFLGYFLRWEPMVTWGSAMALGVTLLSVVRLARPLGGTPETPVVSALVLASVPVVVFQSASGYVDLTGAAFVLAGVALALAPGVRARPLLVGLAWGIAVGTKPTCWLYVLLATVGLGVAAYRTGRLAPRAVLSLGAGLVVPSGFWFLRATLATGNPFFPFAVLGGAGVTPTEITPADYHLQYVPSALHWLVYPWLETKRTGFPYGTGTGLGALFATVVPVGIVLALVDAWRARMSSDPQVRHRRVVLLAFVVLLVVWWVVLRRMPRFGIPLLAVSVLLAVPPLVDRLSPYRYLGPVILAASLVVAAVAGFLPAHDLLSRIRHDRWDRAFSYGYPPLLDSLPPGTTVWNASARDADNYSLAGAGLANRIVPDEWGEGRTPAEMITRHGIDVVVDRYPFTMDEALTELGATLLYDDTVGSRAVDRWRIWQLLPADRAAGFDR